MIHPTIHLNGTGRETLQREVESAAIAVQGAITEVSAMTVHGRDYYPQGAQAYSVARCEQDARLRRLREVLDELVEMYNKLEKE